MRQLDFLLFGGFLLLFQQLFHIKTETQMFLNDRGTIGTRKLIAVYLMYYSMLITANYTLFLSFRFNRQMLS